MPKNKQVEKWLKKKKSKQQYWQVKVLLNNLKLKYSERFPGQRHFCIEVPLFGMRFRFSNIEEPEDAGWKIFFIDENKLDKEPKYFYEDVMWYLTEKGYFLYIYESELGGNGKIAKSILIDGGWGQRIIEKRIEMCGKKAEHTFMKTRMEAYLEVPTIKILSMYPGFFGYLF